MKTIYSPIPVILPAMDVHGITAADLDLVKAANMYDSPFCLFSQKIAFLFLTLFRLSHISLKKQVTTNNQRLLMCGAGDGAHGIGIAVFREKQ